VTEVALPRLEPRIYTEEGFTALKMRSPRFAQILEKEGVVISEAERREL